MVAASLHGTLGQVVITVVATLFVYWATERYAELLAAGARGRVLDRRNVMAALRHGWPMLESSYSPVVVLLVASVLGAELKTAVLAALCLSTVLLAGLGYGAACRSDATTPDTSRSIGISRSTATGWPRAATRSCCGHWTATATCWAPPTR